MYIYIIYTLYIYIYISTSRSHSFITEFIRGAKHGAAPRCHRRHLSGVRGGCTGPGSGSHATRCGTWCLGISNVGSELVRCDLQILQSKNIQGICGQNQSHFHKSLDDDLKRFESEVLFWISSLTIVGR